MFELLSALGAAAALSILVLLAADAVIEDVKARHRSAVLANLHRAYGPIGQ